MRPNFLSKITVKGYKSISNETSLQISPVTVLTGSNSSGKSSFFQTLLLLKQTLEQNYNPGPLLINGSHVKFDKYSQFFSFKGNNEKSSEIIIKLETENGSYFQFTFTYNEKRGVELKNNIICHYDEKKEIEIFESLTHDQIIKLNEEIEAIYNIFSKNFEPENDGKDQPKKKSALKIFPRRCFLELGIEWSDEEKKEPEYTPIPFPYRTIIVKGFVEEFLSSIIHLPADRGNKDRYYVRTFFDEDLFPGPIDPYIGSLISSWIEKKSPLINKLQKALKELQLAKEIKVGNLADTSVEILIPKKPTMCPEKTSEDIDEWLNISDAGFGLSQVLPVLVALFVAKKGQLVIIEQPEIHLHPSLQFKISEYIVEAANNGAIIVVETHSEFIHLGIQSQVAKGKMKYSDVIFHCFNRNCEGATEINSTKLTEDGVYENKQWNDALSDVSFLAQIEFLNAVSNKKSKKK